MSDSDTRGWKEERHNVLFKVVDGIKLRIVRRYIGMDTYVWDAYCGNEKLETKGYSRRCACEAAHAHARETK